MNVREYIKNRLSKLTEDAAKQELEKLLIFLTQNYQVMHKDDHKTTDSVLSKIYQCPVCNCYFEGLVWSCPECDLFFEWK